jgi:tRNA(Ile)-lysidine synthase
VAEVSNDAIYLNTDRITRLHLAMQRQIFRKAIVKLSGNLKDIEAEHVTNMIDFLSKPAGKSLYLPRGLRLQKEYGRLVLTKGDMSLCPLPGLEDTFNINIPGETVLSGWHVKTEIVNGPIQDFDRNGYSACFDLNKTGMQLKVRKRRPGDNFQPLNAGFTKKLQDFMVDEKIPRMWRSQVPLLCSPTQIVWVVGWQIDDRVKVTTETSQILTVKFMRLNR